MSSNRIGFFQDKDGDYSLARLLVFLIVVCSVGIAILQVIKTGHIDIAGFSAMTGISLGTKLFQNYQENQTPTIPPLPSITTQVQSNPI